MISLFELSVGMAGSKIVPDNLQRYGSPVCRNRSDVVKKVVDPVGFRVGDKRIAKEPMKTSSITNKKSSGTPMKMLIAQEMLKEPNPKLNPPGLVARLMGLDGPLPVQQPVRTAKRNSHDCHPRSKSTGSLRGRRQQKDGHFDRLRSCEIHSCSYEKECRDVCEVWQQHSMTNRFTDQPLLKGRLSEDKNGKRMDLVRQKFMEAKRLATDERLLESKEFQDALDVLSSNRDLFLKFLDEPNSLFSKRLEDLHLTPPPTQKKRITVLKSSNSIEAKGEKYMGNQQYTVATVFSQPKAESLSQPTRIVVLKPSPARTHAMKAIATTPISSPELPQHSEFYRSLEASEAPGSREIAKEITRQMRESMGGHRRDESLLSSVLSNGYAGDESSFEKSENEYMEEDGGDFIDSEFMTTSSRRSWDCNDRNCSPYSLTTFGRANVSPESSVIREAKKRLSERWALVASNGIGQEQTEVWRCPSTLRDMLAIPEVKKKDKMLAISSSKSCGGEEDLRVPSACTSISREKDEDGVNISPKKISRSNSMPVVSSVYENIGKDAEVSDPHNCEPSIVGKEVRKSKSGKSSFKGKVSSFFSRNKKSSKQSTASAPLVGMEERFQSNGKKSDDLSKNVHESLSEGGTLVNAEEKSVKASSLTSECEELKHGNLSSKAVISLEKLGITENLSGNQGKFRLSKSPSENQCQPSPTSVLDPQFEDDVHNESPSSEIVDASPPQALSRSAPIESIARSLSWDDSHSETSYPNNPLELLREDEDEQERFTLVKSMLWSSGLDNEMVDTAFSRWHSPESPLDPALLIKLMDQKQEGTERRSSKRLVFDCVNAALLYIGQSAISSLYPWTASCCEARKGAPSGGLVASEVLKLVRDWFSCERNRVLFDAENNNLAVDRLLRKELVGRGWAESVQSEIDNVSEEIGQKVYDDLIGEALADITAQCFA